MQYRRLFLAVILAAFTSGLYGQVMATAGAIPPESVGLPPKVPALTLLGMVNPGRLMTDPSIPPKGAVSEVFYEELRAQETPAGPAGEVTAAIRTKYDENGKLMERTETRYGRETKVLYGYQEDRLVNMESANRGEDGPEFWSYWTYDDDGMLAEFRRGQRSEIQNHESNFEYDNQKRLVSVDYFQGPEDKLFRRTDFRYASDNGTIVVSKTYLDSKIVDHETRFLDTKGQVVRVVLDSEGREPNNLAQNLFFRYDDQGRLIEQTTDAEKFSEAGAEHDLPPGTISIAYDDAKRTKTTTCSFPGEGTLQMVVMENDEGATVGYTLKQLSGQEPPRETSSAFECDYDPAGNWTSCRQFIDDSGKRTIKQDVRRTITYR